MVILALAGLLSDSQAAEATALAAARASITGEAIREHVNVLADDTFEGREAGTRGGRAAAGYIVQKLAPYRLKGAGDEGSVFQAFDDKRNILVLLEGSDPKLKKEVVVVSAHYDHVGYGSPRTSYGPIGYIHRGADDNASGVAGLLALIDALSKVPAPPRRTLLFAFWDGEEKGLLGSKHWVEHPTIPLKQIALMLNVDMIGRLRPQGLEVFGSRTAQGFRQFTSRVNSDPDLPLTFPWTLKADSDHWSFASKNVPVIMLHTGLHGDYHRPSDTVDKLNFDGLQAASRLLFDMTLSAAQADTLPAFRQASRGEYDSHRQALERTTVSNAPPRLGVSWENAFPHEMGCLLTNVTPGGAAERAGLHAGDRVLMIGGRLLLGDDDFRTAIVTAPAATEIVVQRDPAVEAETLLVPLAGEGVRLGVSWREDEGEPGAILVIGVVPSSPAARAGIAPLDRIYELAGKPIAGGEEFQSRIQQLSGSVSLLVERTGRCVPLRVELPQR